MVGIIKLVGIQILGAVAYEAGKFLWDEILKEKAHQVVENFKKKRESAKEEGSDTGSSLCFA